MTVGKAVAGGNQTPPQAPSARVQASVNPIGLIDGEVRESLLKMEQDITTQAQAISAQATSEGAPTEKTHASTTVTRLRDFTRMNPPVYNGSKTN